jgi:hypothetical protein
VVGKEKTNTRITWPSYITFKKKNFFGFDWNMMLVFKLMGLTLIRGEFYFVD